MDRKAAAPPALNKQFTTSIDLSCPLYQFWVMFSWFTTRTRVLGRAFRRWLAMSTQTKDEEQPMPERL